MKQPGLLKILLFMLLASPVMAGESDHDAVLRAVRAGEIRPLTEIMAIVRPQLQGEVIKVEAERKQGVWVYEFRVVDTSGQRSDVYVDGKTARIIQVKRK